MKKINRKITAQLFMTLAIMAALPVTVWMAQRIQELRTEAGPGSANLSLVPSSKTNNVGELDTLNVFINPGGERVTGVEFYINYDPALVEVTDVVPGQFFTDPSGTIGQPIVINKRISNGQIGYSIGFPLGSNHSSTETKNVAIIKYTAKSQGTANLTFVTSGTPQTLVSDVNALNVLGSATGGTINVGAGTRLYFSNPRPANPQAVNTNFDIDVLMDTAGQNVDGVDVRARFDKTMLQVVSMSKPVNSLSYPQFAFDNVAGTVSISANIGINATPITGSGIVVATIKAKSIVASSTLLSYDFVAGNRNDSNMVLSGTLRTSDPVDILSAVTNASIFSVIDSVVTPTQSPIGIPDLIVTDFSSIPTSPTHGDSVSFSVTIKNQGSITASSGSIKGVGFYIDGSNTAQTWTDNNTSAIAPGASLTLTTNGPNWNATFGSHSVIAWVDDASRIPESNEGNNKLTKTIVVGSQDLPTPTGGAPVTPTQTPAPTATTVPTIGLSSTPTPILPRTILVRFAFQGVTRSGVTRTKPVTLVYRPLSGTQLTTLNVSTNSNGEANITLIPGDYVFLIKAPGYLASSFGSALNPIRVTSNLSSLDLTQSPLLGGDFNGDGAINEIDFTSFFLPSFRTTSSTVDLDGSGEVNNLDFGIMRSNWGLLSGSI